MVSDEEQAGQSTNARLSASGTPLGGRLAGLSDARYPIYVIGAKELLDQVVKGEHPLSAIYQLKPDGDGAGSIRHLDSALGRTWTVHVAFFVSH
jgi:hypothetical protein